MTTGSPILPAYERNPRQRALDATLVASGRDDRGFYLVLDDTILYPEGGGQPADRGTISGVAIIDVQREGREIRHYVDAGDLSRAEALAPGPVAVALDWQRRYDHMQQHTAQHLFTATTLTRFGWRTVAFHLGARVCDIELDVASLTPDDLARLEDAVALEILAAHPVRARRVTPEEKAQLPVRSRGLPDDHEGDIRLVEIEGVDLNTCGGTHLASTAEIGAFAIVGTEPMRGGTRVYFVAGERARLRLREHERRAALLRAVFGTNEDEIPQVAAQKLEQLKDANARIKRLQERLADAIVDALATDLAALRTTHVDDGDAALVQRIAQRLSARDDAALTLITAGGPREGFFALAAGTAWQGDLKAAGARVAATLEGRGGGAGRVYQGKAARVDKREEARAELAAT